ncbi:MAG: DUF4166 domain-containing protein [Rudaea sp.]|nr:DUF4166 domain-containing protein [Rudaea sp.]
MSTLFMDVLGDAAFSTLPARVQALHRATGTRTYRGKADVLRGTGLLARLCGLVTAQPPAAQGVALQVQIAATSAGERWTRNFAGHLMRSTMWARDGLLCERLGLVTFGFALSTEDGVLVWRVRSVRALGLPLPAPWFDGVRACESEVAGRYRFDVEARLPLAGLLVHYRGWLDVG